MLPQEILVVTLDDSGDESSPQLSPSSQTPWTVTLGDSDEELNQQQPPPPPTQVPLNFLNEMETVTPANLTDFLMQKLKFPIGFNFLEILEVILNAHSAVTDEVLSQQMQNPPFKTLMEINQSTSANLILLQAQIEGVKKQLEDRNLVLRERMQQLRLEIEQAESKQKAAEMGGENSGPPLTTKQAAQSDTSSGKKSWRKSTPSAKRERSKSMSDSASDSEAASTSGKVPDDDVNIKQPQLPKTKKGKKGKRSRKQ